MMWEYHACGPKPVRSSLSSIPAPITPSTRATSRPRQTSRDTASNSTRRRRINRSRRCTNFLTRRSARKQKKSEHCEVSIKAIVFDAYGTLYDIQSVASVTEQAFPGYGEIITQVWRIKQLEYTWLRSLMRRYQDFAVVTRESLAYALRCLGLKYDAPAFARIMDKYLHLDLYPDAI